ncbi:hypothetical protein Tco_0886635, partial [Tanacetum coccineum]
FPDFGRFMVQICGRTKAMPTISIDDLQSSLHKVGNGKRGDSNLLNRGSFSRHVGDIYFLGFWRGGPFELFGKSDSWIDGVASLVRIEKTKRSKNDQKPTRNEKKTKSQEQDKEFSQRSQPDQPDTVKLSQRKE